MPTCTYCWLPAHLNYNTYHKSPVKSLYKAISVLHQKISLCHLCKKGSTQPDQSRRCSLLEIQWNVSLCTFRKSSCICDTYQNIVCWPICCCTCPEYTMYMYAFAFAGFNKIQLTLKIPLVQCYTTARVFVLRIRVLCAFPTHCTCVEFKLRMKRKSTYFETHEYSLAAPNAFQR